MYCIQAYLSCPSAAHRRPLVSALRLIALLAVMVWHSAHAAPSSDLWAYWAAHDRDAALQVDHSLWQTLLDGSVQRGGDHINRVDYKGFVKTNEHLLDTYLAYLQSLEPTSMSPNQQLAFWINLYNAQTVKVVLGYPDKDSILKMRPSLLSVGPWDEKYLQIEGKDVSLNDIEHRILRPIWADHRLHFALNCASLGCPDLSTEAYRAETIQGQLQQAEDLFLSQPRAIELTQDGVLMLSSLFDWYLEDFADSEQALLQFLAERAPNLATTLRTHQSKIRYHYDWALNGATP